MQKICFYLLMMIGLTLITPATCLAQEDEAKSIYQVEEVVKKRRAGFRGDTGKKAGLSSTKRKRVYRVANVPKTRTVLSGKENEVVLVGSTIWRLKPSAPKDSGKGLEETGTDELYERLGSSSALTLGEKVRIGIESLSRDGYLYIVDRELYADGSYSPPKLIYPTAKTGNNFVVAGVVTYIPNASGSFKVTTNAEKNQVAEVLTLIISPVPLIEKNKLRPTAIEVSIVQFDEWLKKWEAGVTVLEQSEGSGEPLTAAEKQARADLSKGLEEEPEKLSQDDPSPQTVYRSVVKRKNPVLVHLIIKYEARSEK